MRKNYNFRRGDSYLKQYFQNNNGIDRTRLILKIAAIASLIALALFLFYSGSLAVIADENADEQLNESIKQLLADLDLSELEKYLSENTDSYLLNFGSTAKEIVEYLIKGDLQTDYSGYISELLNVVFGGVIKLLPAFATVTAIALLSAVVSSAEGNILGKSTSKIIHLACYALIILIITTMLTGIVSQCIACVNNIKRQVEIITPVLATLTVLTGGNGSAAIYQPSAIFLTGGAIEIVSGLVFPATITVVVLNLLSKFNTQLSFSGVSSLIKSILKWVIGITVTIFSIFITMQSTAATLFDGIFFKATKYVVSNSVPIVGNFLSSGFDMLNAAGHLIKNSVGLCGIVILLGEIIQPVIMLAAFSLILKLVGAVVQPVGENILYSLLAGLSKDIEYFLAGLLTVSFMYALMIMLIITSANSFI